eukprot:8474404-Pyramimonas_sp.AAC.1
MLAPRIQIDREVSTVQFSELSWPLLAGHHAAPPARARELRGNLRRFNASHVMLGSGRYKRIILFPPLCHRY